MEHHIRKVVSRTNSKLPMSAILCLPTEKKRNERIQSRGEQPKGVLPGAQKERQGTVMLTNLPLDSNRYRGEG
jgi:hypothetical protein